MEHTIGPNIQEKVLEKFFAYLADQKKTLCPPKMILDLGMIRQWGKRYINELRQDNV